MGIEQKVIEKREKRDSPERNVENRQREKVRDSKCEIEGEGER